ncbi:MAG: RHS repeat-associated core domain-containing protein, partial [Candidatus Bathyarchaeia archaeon]
GSWVTYLHQDHLGSTRLETDGSSVIPFRGNYQPYGVDYGTRGSEVFRYTGKPSDSTTGLYYYGARYYDPSVARFITEDTAAASYSDPQSLNRYVYCRDNPHKYTDPDGKFLVPLWAAGAILGGAWNFMTYMVEHRGKEINFGDLATTIAAGAIGGAITLGTGGLAGESIIGKLVANTVGDMLGSAVETGISTSYGTLTHSGSDPMREVTQSIIAEPTMGFVTSCTSTFLGEVLPLPNPIKKEVSRTIVDISEYLIPKILTTPALWGYDSVEKMRGN